MDVDTLLAVAVDCLLPHHGGASIQSRAYKAMAAKLARLIYRMLRYGMKYVNQGAEFYETQHRKQQVIHLKRKAAQLGLQIIEVAAAA